jgi:hypothetical protein
MRTIRDIRIARCAANISGPVYAETRTPGYLGFDLADRRTYSTKRLMARKHDVAGVNNYVRKPEA